jgi:hypothetical protein
MSPDAPPLAARPQRRRRVRRSLLVALALSLVVHFALSFVPDELPSEPEQVPLTASLRELPPPPTIAPPVPPKPRPVARRAPTPAPAAPVIAVPEPAPLPAAEPAPPETAAAEAAEAAPDVTIGPPEPPVLAESIAAAPEGIVERKVLPPRVDLAYKVFYAGGFHVGTATYRFEHADNRYTISTIGEARGLAALFVRGRGRVESRGLITGQGLQPTTLEVDKFNQRGRERAEFDWEAGIAVLHEDKVAPLELPTFDPLTLMWQFYFRPPEGEQQSFAFATTRRVNKVTITRERVETLQWGDEPIATEVWHRTSEDGKTEAHVWLAPSLRWIPLKIRAEHQTRGTIEAVLDAIRVDEPLAQAPVQE